jgi:penicillin-binding protein 2
MLGRDEKIPPSKLTIAQYGIIAIFLILCVGLWRLQVSGNEKYSAQAEGNSIREVDVLAPRGQILDREGRKIVDNYPSFTAFVMRDRIKDIEPDVDAIANGLNIPPGQLRDRLRKIASRPPSEPLILKEDLTPADVAFVESHRNELPELETITAHRRLYPTNGFMAHVIGYVGEISEDTLNSDACFDCRPGDMVGQSGIEKMYNDYLKGKNGKRRVEVNNRGKVLRELGEEPYTAGKNLKLTIDLDLQIAAEEAMEGKNGAVIAMDPNSGEILAMVSRPTFDPNSFSVRISRDDWNKLITDPAKPLFNKAIQAQLAPGSVFKIIMAVAGMQEGIAQGMHVNCGGGKNFYGRFFKCWIAAKHSAHGDVGIEKGIYQSCDVFFYTLGEKLGIGRIAKYALGFGLGQKTGIDLPQEATGVMPSEEWKIKNFKQKWYAGETISVSIGQGAVATTPVQLMRAIAAIATGGNLRRPHLVSYDSLPAPYNDHYREALARYPEKGHFDINAQNLDVITGAMANVPGPLGTAPSAHLEGIEFAGKTGSAQTISNEARKSLRGAEYKDNAWFVGFTPRRNPEIVVAVLFEGGEHGQFAARIASQVIKTYVEKKRRTPTHVAQTPAAPTEVSALWNAPDADSESGERLAGGRFTLPAGLPRRRIASAPGVN